MTKKELLEMLKSFADDAFIMIASPTDVNDYGSASDVKLTESSEILIY